MARVVRSPEISMTITPASSVAGHRVAKTVGLVRGNTIRARHLGKDILAVLRNIAGGEVRGVQMGLINVAQRSNLSLGLINVVRDGRYLAGPGEAVVGSVLARNLGLAVGDEIVVLGTAKEGGVAATLATVVGTFTSGQVALDRALMQIPIGDFREAWGLAPDEAHVVVVLALGQLEHRVAGFEVVPGDQARGFKLGQYAVDRGQPHIFTGRQQGAIDVLSTEVLGPAAGRFQDLEDLHPRQGNFQAYFA